MADPVYRRAALIATGVTLPLIVVFALVIGALTGSSDPKSTAPAGDAKAALMLMAPPRADVDAAACAKVLAQLPVNLGVLNPRVVRTTPDTPFVVAWGAPPVVFRCGENRPADLQAGSSAQFFSATGVSGPYFDVTSAGSSANVYTTVDRAVYVSLTIPGQYKSGPLPPVAAAIGKALPAVCTTDSSTPDLTKLCTRRA